MSPLTAWSSLSMESILWLQQLSLHAHWLDDFAVSLTLLGDPKLLFLYLVPLVYWCAPRHCRRSLGVELLLSLMLSDVLNALLKWPARGDRPYWMDDDYSSSGSGVDSDANIRRVREFSVTCESGYGFPSGHLMVTTSVATVLLARLPSRFGRWKTAAMVCTCVFLFLLGLTRMYVGAHFPGQVIAGAVCGLLLGRLIVRGQLEVKLSAHWHAMQRRAASSASFLWRAAGLGATGSLAILVVAIAEFLLLSLFMDPLHSLVLAREGCEATRAAAMALAADAGNPQAQQAAAEQAQQHLERGPFMGVSRDAGACFGGAMALALLQIYALDESPPPPSPRSSHAFLSDALESVPLQHAAGNRLAPSAKLSASATAAGVHSFSWREVLLRGCFGLLEASLFRWLLLRLVASPVVAALGTPFPVLAVYGQAFFVFAALTLNFLFGVPFLWSIIANRVHVSTTRATALR
jgi:membrane-associated phospholipid phosphatase